MDCVRGTEKGNSRHEWYLMDFLCHAIGNKLSESFFKYGKYAIKLTFYKYHSGSSVYFRWVRGRLQKAIEIVRAEDYGVPGGEQAKKKTEELFQVQNL